ILLRSNNFYLKFSGALAGGIMLIPLAVALIAYLRAGGFTDDNEISNAAEPRATTVPEPEAESEAIPSIVYTPLDSRRLILAGILIVVFVVLSMIPVYRFGDDIKVGATRDDAIRAASAFLTQRHIDADSYHHVASLDQNIDPDALKYL